MSRRDSYLDAMLKHLGTTYYQTLQGEATSSDVAEAVSSVREEMARRPGQYPVFEDRDQGRQHSLLSHAHGAIVIVPSLS